MPELPEVEVCRRGLAPELVGTTICGVVIRAPKLRHEIPPALRELLPGGGSSRSVGAASIC